MEEDNNNYPQSTSVNSEIPKSLEIPEVQNELSKVATNPKQSIFIVVIISIVFIIIFFKLFINNSKPTNVALPTKPTEVSKPTQDNAKNLPAIPKLPEAPKLELPKDLPPPPPIAPAPKIPDTPTITLPTLEKDTDVATVIPLPPSNSSLVSEKLIESDAEKKRRETKRKSSIVLIAGNPNVKTASQIAEESTFQDRGDMSYVLGRGKIIEAVLESAINSDLVGEIRAIVSRDVFSERDKIILIPKGSKVFGIFSTGKDGSLGRISIIWTRIDLSSGYSINLDAVSVDSLGRHGQQGRLDQKFKERLTNSVLVSLLNIGVAAGLNKLVPPPANSQTAAADNTTATNIQNLALTINGGPGTDDFKISQICASVLNAITDTTSLSYTSMVQACTTAQNPTGSVASQRLAALMVAVNSSAASLINAAATSVDPTQTQIASTQAYTDITDTMKDMLKQQEFKPTITIDQGTVVKIYVNKDYRFPKSVLKKSRLVQ